MTKFSCLLVGENSLLIQCAETLQLNGGTIVAIATETGNIRDWALEREIPLLDSSGDMSAQLIAFEYDWLFSIANLRMIPESVWRRARKGAINFHDGPLPELAGLNTPSWSILEGRSAHGVTWHSITEGIDEGDILASERFEIDADDTALTVNTRCYEAGIASFARLAAAIGSGTVRGQAQDLSRRTYYARDRRPVAAGTLDFSRSAAELSRIFRALSFGSGYRNPLTAAKILTAHGVFLVRQLTALNENVWAAPGQVIAIRGTGVVLSTGDGPVLVDAIGLENPTERLSAVLRVGDRLPILGPADRAALEEAHSQVVKFEGWFSKRLAHIEDIDLSGVVAAETGARARYKTVPLDLPVSSTPEVRAAMVLAFVARFSGKTVLDVAFSNEKLAAFCDAIPGYFARSVPLRVDASQSMHAGEFVAAAIDAMAATSRRLSYPLDLIDRNPGLNPPQLSIGLSMPSGERSGVAIEGCAITFVVSADGFEVIYDENRVNSDRIATLVSRLAICCEGFDDKAEFRSIPLISGKERDHLLHDLNQTASVFDEASCLHELIALQAQRQPDATAVSFMGVSISYSELEARAGRIARVLAAKGAGPDMIVGVHLHRGIDLVVGAYAILKAGAAYLPLDPAFPSNRLAMMVEDSAARIVLTSRPLRGTLPTGDARVLCVEDIYEGREVADLEPGTASPRNLAYVIYTSGSTGRPKGVMIEHRNVLNFFAGMDDRVPRSTGTQDVWLAVTSLSFDISVLEIFWTLSRGFKVVVHASELDQAKADVPVPQSAGTGMDFSLFYWGNDDGAGPEKYRTLLDGARFADNNGFQAVWIPERHFHAFGGPYPNPSVTGAAVAAVTSNISIRAGSCVLPLHHPARVAEEWAVVDNLSGGRAGLAFASGWMPEDFVLRPENAPPNNKSAMLRDIETVRRLWRGEKVDFDFGSGKVGVVTQPRPVSRELPVWITTAGNPDTYRDAARLGANVLTHLLGQSIEELAGKIAIYRKTLVEQGLDPNQHKVTLMLHTLIGQDREQVRDLARGPMKDYLRSAAALIKQYAWAFPAFKKPAGITNPMEVDLQALEPEELEAILEFAFLRYFEDSGLFGTVEDATERVRQLREIGVDEVACLIDFGLPAQTVLEALVPLAEVVRLARAPEVKHGLAADIRREGVTHLQCTPSMATMFLGDAGDRSAMAQLKHLFIGGEPLKRALVEELSKVTAAKIQNMYGPTETTIWSSTTAATAEREVVPLGKPIANTQFYLLDRWLEPVPPGEAGELFIGGEGVARGYLNREDLTRERFVPNPFAPGRMYKTGDLARYGSDGTLEFIGRVDNQVKIRGNRIELGEIETRLSTLSGVRDAVVIVREDKPGDSRIVAYLRTSVPVTIEAVREHLADDLPEYMMPSHVVTLDAFPLTPNAKVDRAKLPKPKEEEIAPSIGAEEAHDAVQRTIADAFKRSLNLIRVGLHDNFFALGGHSLLAVQVHRDLKSTIAPSLTITDMFRFPTVAGLASHIAGNRDGEKQLDRVAERAAMRRAAMENRRSAFVRSPNAL
jgi:natural product biosynthesis luciferase-like monooxygenase protein